MAYIQDVQESVPALPEAGNLTSFVVLSQNENGRRLNFKIVGVDIPSGSTATFSGTKPDGVVYSTTGTISGNIVTVNEDIQMTAVAGSWDAKIRVLNGGNVIASAKVRMTIDADPVAPDSIPSDSQLDGIVAECQAYAESARSDAYGSPLTASTAAGMIDKTRVYVYTGSETGYTNGHWYYWDGTAWTDGGTYNSSGIQTDTTLSVPGMAADAKAVGDEISDLKEDIDDIESSIGTNTSALSLTTSVGYVRADGTINTSQTSYKHTQNISCSGVKNFIYTGKSNGSAMYVAVFFGADDSVVSTYGHGTSPATSYSDAEIPIPTGASYVIFTSEGSGTFTVSKVELVSVADEIAEINDIINNGTVYYKKATKRSCRDNVSDGYVKADGTINTDHVWKHTEWIPVNGMSSVKYTGYAFYATPYCVVFRDVYGTVVGAYLNGNSSEPVSYVDEEITIPANAYDVAFTWYNINLHPEGNASYLLKTELPTDSIMYPYLGKKWVCVGDSLTAINNSASDKYHMIIAAELGFNVVNMGDGGTGYMKGYDTSRAFYQRVLSCPSDADVVTAFGSGNDLNYFDDLGDYTDTGTSTICGCVNTFLDNYYSICPTAPIGIIAPTPWMNTPTTTPDNRMEQYVAKLKQIAEYRGVPFLDLYHESNLRPEDETNRGLCFYSESLDGQGDGVHPNNLGHKIISSKIREFVKKLI